MKSKKHSAIVSGIMILTLLSIVWWSPKFRSRTRIYNHPFAEVVNYMNSSFKTNITACGNANSGTWAWGPHFLATDTVYFVDTELYEPENILKFEAWFYQIGGEYNTFIIRKVDNSKTSITVDQVVKFYVTFPHLGSSETEILDTIESDLKK